MSGRRVTGVKLKSGGSIAAGTVVCAAGWHSYKIAAMAGFDLPVRPRKRLAFVVDCPGASSRGGDDDRSVRLVLPAGRSLLHHGMFAEGR